MFLLHRLEIALGNVGKRIKSLFQWNGFTNWWEYLRRVGITCCSGESSLSATIDPPGKKQLFLYFHKIHYFRDEILMVSTHTFDQKNLQGPFTSSTLFLLGKLLLGKSHAIYHLKAYMGAYLGKGTYWQFFTS